MGPGPQSKTAARNPDVLMWMVKSQAREHGSFREIHAKDGASNPEVKELSTTINMTPDENVRRSRGGFLGGQPLHEDKTATIPICRGANLPRFCFRVTHEGSPDGEIKPMPYGGLKSRGHGVVKTDPLHFQDLVQRHLNWRWRGKSSFLSVAGTLNLVKSFADMYREASCEGIKLHLIRMHGKEWEQGGQNVFRVHELVCRMGLRPRPSYHYEYLIEGEIPEECIIETVDGWRVPGAWSIYTQQPTDLKAWFEQKKQLVKLMAEAKRRMLQRREKLQEATETQDKEKRDQEEVHDEKDARKGEEQQPDEIQAQEGPKATEAHDTETGKNDDGRGEHQNHEMQEDMAMPEEGDKPEADKSGGNDKADEGNMPRAGEAPDESDTQQEQTQRDAKTQNSERTHQHGDKGENGDGMEPEAELEASVPSRKRRAKELTAEVRKRCRGFQRVSSRQY